MRWVVVKTIFFLLAATGGVIGQERYVLPRDEAPQDASFYAFRTSLITAAESRDKKYILRILDPNIELSFGGHRGVKDFKEFWEFDKPTTKFWKEFLPVIKNGGSFDRKNRKRTNLFLAPYTFASFPDDLDAFDHSTIFGSGVNLRERPNAEAPIIANLSYNVVMIAESVPKAGGSDETDWYEVVTLGGKRGYVKAEYVRSPIDYRAAFEKKRGQWKMTFFITGD